MQILENGIENWALAGITAVALKLLIFDFLGEMF